ncbi:MAG: multicopper oxidase family protein [Gammaproteobacteria bacterium]|jgi:FtsP/CotA-like multicopper oxidase with cupredoxin domain|nr:multicopper oxidase family protein [Gammaproteobacteria bacterium]
MSDHLLNRRKFIKAGIAGIAGIAGSACLRHVSAQAPQPEIRLIASPGQANFSAGQKTATRVMHYNQSIPGPVLRLPQGRESVIRFENFLDESSSVHWHGLRIANAMDGVPGMTQAAVEPGESFEYRLVPPDAGTYWYHSHQRSWAQLALGLAGVLIVEEHNPPPVDQDLVFAIDDWRLDDNMQFDRNSLGAMHDWAHGGRMGNVITVNGETEKTYHVARGERVRMRLVNIANARVMNLLFNEPEISVIAIDGQPVEPFTPAGGKIQLAPGQRTDLIIDMSADPGQRSLIEVVIGEYAYEVASFVYGQNVQREQALAAPIRLAQNPLQNNRLPREFLHVHMVMEGGAMGGMRSATYNGREMNIRELVKNQKIWAINGIAGMSETPLFRVPRGSAVSLDIVNDNSWPHAMHVHGHHFIYHKAPGIWRDTALFERGEQGTMRFIADNPGKWLIHCHMVEHMAGGMVTWFEVS